MEKEKERQATRRSPTVAAKVMHHISSRLVALMHEVTSQSQDETSPTQQQQQQSDDPGFSGRRQVGPPTRRFRPPSSASIKSDTSGNGQEDNSSPLQSESPENRAKLSKSTSKSAEVLDLSHRRMSLDDKVVSVGMSKSTSSDYDVWQGVHRNSAGAITSVAGPSGAVPGQRRGSLGLGHAVH